MLFSPIWCSSGAPITTLPTYAEWLIFPALPLLAYALTGARCEADVYRGTAKGVWFGFMALVFVGTGLALQFILNSGRGVRVQDATHAGRISRFTTLFILILGRLCKSTGAFRS